MDYFIPENMQLQCHISQSGICGISKEVVLRQALIYHQKYEREWRPKQSYKDLQGPDQTNFGSGEIRTLQSLLPFFSFRDRLVLERAVNAHNELLSILDVHRRLKILAA